jgi:hypothetical protein
MIGLISQDDPPVVAVSTIPPAEIETRRDIVHHPKHAMAIASRCKNAGVECRLMLHDDPQTDRAAQTSGAVAFLLEKLTAAGAK